MTDPQDIQIDVYTSGIGTKPTVKATHIPTGISVVESGSMSQFRNREKALIVLGEMVENGQDVSD